MERKVEMRIGKESGNAYWKGKWICVSDWKGN
jgi:hypothetical protein